MGAFLELSNELIYLILVELDGQELFGLLQSCRTLNGFIKGNKLLHKEIYLSRYDDPTNAGEPDWEEELQQNVKLDRILRSEHKDKKRIWVEFVTERISWLMETANVNADESRNIALLDNYFDEATGMDNRDVFLCSSTLFDEGGTSSQRAAETTEARQASARLHCLWGRPIDPVPYTRFQSRFGSIRFSHATLLGDDTPAMNTRLRTDDVPVHQVARGRVYDLSDYTLPSLWGPFMDDGSHRVDWEKVEAVMVVLGFNLSKFTVRSEGRFPYIWEHPWIGATPRSFISPPPSTDADADAESDEPSIASFLDQLLNDFDEFQPRLPKQPDPALEALDPYGVTGTWMRVVCFLDYNDLYRYNFPREVGDEHFRRHPIDNEEGIITLAERVRPPSRVDHTADDWGVAIRLIRIKLRVTRIEPPPTYEVEDGDDKPDPDFSEFTGERLPIVHFTGNSRSLHASWDPNANSKIRGSVRQTPSGAIRWTTFSIFHGEERWRSEGIQVGGLRSSRGVLGNWFDKDFDEHGPAGPTAFWKESDSLQEKRRDEGVPVAFF